jgi:hypothetical protein
MPSLVWTSVVLVVLLLPGLFFYFGLYAPDRFSRDTAPRNPLATLGAVVLVSVLAHAVAGLVSGWLGAPVAWEKVLDAMHVGGRFSIGAGQRVAEYYTDSPVLIPLYVVATVGLGWSAGLVMGWLSVKARIPGMIQFPWAYDLRGTKDAGAITYAHVLSTIQHDGRVLLYRGRLQHFGLNADGTFAYIALAATEQRFLDLSHPDPYLRDRTPIGGTRGIAITAEPGGLAQMWARLTRKAPVPVTRMVGGALMMIAGANIRDVVFQAEFKIDFDRADLAIARDPAVEAALQLELPAVSDEQIENEVRKIDAEELVSASDHEDGESPEQ